MEKSNSPEQFRKLKKYIIIHTGLHYYDQKDEQLKEKLLSRITKLKLKDYGNYYDYLLEDLDGKQELDRLITQLTIGETYFFRNKEIFKILKETIFPALIYKNRDIKRIRIWSAGCSTGEEPYSLAIMLKRDFINFTKDWQIDIIGTDINRNFLAAAMTGKYKKWSFRQVDEDIQKNCFSKEGDSWAIKPEYKDYVNFEYHNLIKNQFPSLITNIMAFDLILCRNVMIYFNYDVQKKLIQKFRNVLLPEGWLIVGHSEHNTYLYSNFQSITTPKAIVYRKVENLSPRPATSFQSEISLPADTKNLIDEDEKQNPSPQKSGLPEYTPWDPESFTTQVNNLGKTDKKSPVPNTGQTNGETIIPPDKTEKQNNYTASMIAGYLKKGKWKQAKELCKKLFDTDKFNPYTYFYYALIEEQEGRSDEAEKYLKKSIYLDRKFILGHYHIALIFQKKKNIIDAKKSLRNALELLDEMDESYIFMNFDKISALELKKLINYNIEILEQL